MLNLLAAVAIFGANAVPALPAATSHSQPRLYNATRDGMRLTEKQRLWFGRAVEHILQGQP